MQTASLMAVLGANCAVQGGLLLSMRIKEPALNWFGGGLLAGSAALLCILARTVEAPFFLTVGIGTGLLIFSFACGWQGFRVFDRCNSSTPTLWPLLIGPLIWMVACTFPSFAASYETRIATTGWIIAGYTCLTGWQVWVGRREPLPSRHLAAYLGVSFAAFMVIRAMLIGVLGVPFDLITEAPGDFSWVAMLLIAIGLSAFSFLCITLAFERDAARRLRDAFSGEFGLADQVEFRRRMTLLMGRSSAGHPVAVLSIRIDGAKSTFRGTGERELEIARRLGRWLREHRYPSDLCGLWGMASVVYLFVGDEPSARLLANDFAEYYGQLREHPRFAGTDPPQIVLRIGTAVSVGPDTKMDDLLGTADEAALKASEAVAAKFAPAT